MAAMDRVRTTNVLLVVVAVLAIGIILKSAETVFVTLFVSFLLAYVMEVPVRLLRRIGLPLWLSVALTALVFFGLLLGLAFLVYSGLHEFARDFPVYQERLSGLLREAVEKIRAFTARSLDLDLGEELGRLSISTWAFETAQSAASSLAVLLVIFVFAVLIVYGKFGLPRKLLVAFPRGANRRIPRMLLQVDREVRKYIGVKTLSSALVGGLFALVVALFGVEFVVIWAALGFLFNYIPAVGPFFPSLFPAVLAIVQSGEFTRGIWVFVVLITTNMAIHNLIEPKIQGEVLNLSFLVVFVSLLFWGWLWGHLGVLLAIPMTSAVKIVLENIPLTSSYASLLEKRPRHRRRH